MTNLLFICSLNKWRSPTAEHLYRNHPDYQVRSAGTSRQARRTVSLQDIRWAHCIYFMEYKHKERTLATFRQELRYKELHVLEVEDRYQYMDPRLVEELRGVLDPMLH